MTVAVLLHTSHAVTGYLAAYMLGAYLLAFIGLGPILGWLVAAWKRPLVKRFVMACILAVAISLTLGATTLYAVSIKCDWYDILWWLCG